MPYIHPHIRTKIDDALDDFIDTLLALPEPSDGDLNYSITRIAHAYINAKGANYKNFNGVIGVLECAKLELYRRKIAPYEDVKITENGDV